jgi:hypothetical protein
MMKMFGQPVDEELVESIRREEELRKVFFKEETKQTSVEIQKPVEPIVQPIVQQVIETPVKILKKDTNRGLSKYLDDLSKEQLIDVIEEMTTNVDIMELYELDEGSLKYFIRELTKQKETEEVLEEEKSLVELAAESIAPVNEEVDVKVKNEIEDLKRSLEVLTKRFNTSVATGSGGGAVRMSDLDDLIAKHDILRAIVKVVVWRLVQQKQIQIHQKLIWHGIHLSHYLLQ